MNQSTDGTPADNDDETSSPIGANIFVFGAVAFSLPDAVIGRKLSSTMLQAGIHAMPALHEEVGGSALWDFERWIVINYATDMPLGEAHLTRRVIPPLRSCDCNIFTEGLLEGCVRWNDTAADGTSASITHLFELQYILPRGETPPC